MKKILKMFVYSYISLYVTQSVINGFFFGGSHNITFLLVLTGVALLNTFLPPILNILSLPDAGPGGIFLSFLMNLIVFYMLTVLLPFFDVQASTISELIIFGIVLPSKSLTKLSSMIFSALLFVVVFNFFKWLGASKSK